MDNEGLLSIITKIPELNFRYLGSFSASNLIPIHEMPKHTFQIVNTVDGIGKHWVVFIKAGIEDIVYFGDSLGRFIDDYAQIRDALQKNNKSNIIYLNFSAPQQADNLCGFYCIYFAYLYYKKFFYECLISDYEVVKFISRYI